MSKSSLVRGVGRGWTVRGLRAALAVGVGSGLVTASAGAGLHAQTPEREPALLELPASTRALALGGAFQLGANDADLLFANPALLERARGLSLGVQLLGGGGRAATLSAAAEGFGGGVGLGLLVLEYGSADAVSGTRPGGIDPLLAEGPNAVSEWVATLAHGRELLGVRVGVSGKLVGQRIGPDRGETFALDLGASRDLKGVTLGVAVQDVGPDLEVDGSGRLPTRVTVGAGRYGRQLGPLDLGAAAALTMRADGELVPGGGIEVGYYPVTGRTFVARLGARRVVEGEALPFTFGGSYWGDRLVLDYAFQAVDGHDGVHRVTVGWR